MTTEEQSNITELEISKPLEEVIKAAKKAIEEIENKSFSERHPELGKMFKCPVCQRRHRGEQCEQRFMLIGIDEDTETGEQFAVYATNDAKPAVKGRRNRRPNPTGIEIIDLTRKIFPTLEGKFEHQAQQMMEARRIALQSLAKKREAEAKRIREEQKESRRKNRKR